PRQPATEPRRVAPPSQDRERGCPLRALLPRHGARQHPVRARRPRIHACRVPPRRSRPPGRDDRRSRRTCGGGVRPMAQLSRARRRGIGLGLAVALAPMGLTGQTVAARPPGSPTSRTVATGDHYQAGWLHRLLLGAHYRDLWATPVAVDVLDLSRFAGGLTPTGCGGRRQTKVLRLLGKDGRQYVFRSVDKDPTLALPPELRATFAKNLVQDQISSAHPGAPLVVAPLLDAAGILHVEPRMALLPDDPRLSGFDCVRPGLKLGMIEERPTEPPDNEVALAGAVERAGPKK